MPSTKAQEKELITCLKYFTVAVNKQRIMELIRQGVDVNLTNCSADSGTALHHVFIGLFDEKKKVKTITEDHKRDLIEIVELLIKHGVDPNKTIPNWAGGAHPLHLAVQLFMPEVVKLVLEAGAHPYAFSDWRRTPKVIGEGMHATHAFNAVEILRKETSGKEAELNLIKDYLDEYSGRIPRIAQLPQSQLRTVELEEESNNLQQQIELLKQEKQELNQQINTLEQKNKKILPEVSAGIAAASAILGVAFFVYPFEEMKALQYVGVIPLALAAHFAGNRFDRDYERAIGFFNNSISPAIGYAWRTISAGIGQGASRGVKPLVEVHDNNGIQPQGAPLVHAEGEIKAPVDFNVVGIAPQKAPLVNAQVRAPVNANAPVKVDAPVRVEAQGGGLRFG